MYNRARHYGKRANSHAPYQVSILAIQTRSNKRHSNPQLNDSLTVKSDSFFLCYHFLIYYYNFEIPGSYFERILFFRNMC